jgi:peptidoglycan/LPS O-acetylase OafA/YrhL
LRNPDPDEPAREIEDPARYSAFGYRPDIDGLRGVAILAVLLYHGGFAFASGGYVGVDVFFVVSGFLIASLVLAEIRNRRFTLVNFYERRVRRLFPAIFALMLACCAASTMLFLPEELRRFGGSLFATATFASNVFFWLETGYFQTDAELKPLIHTWSLAVEEQFYLLVPLLVALGLRRRPRAFVAGTVALLLASLVSAEWAARSAPSAAFYLTPFRLWELALGVLLALPVVPRAGSRLTCECCGWLGLTLIAWSVFTYSWRTSFPGLHAAAPCAGTALVIWSGSGGDTGARRLLSLRPVVFVGLISYSLYLWHWPILSFARYWKIRELSAAETVALLAISVAVAALSWRFVEQPFRRRGGLLMRRPMFATAGATMAALAAYGLVAVASAGWPGRLDAESRRLAAAATDRNGRQQACSFLGAADVANGRACLLGDHGGRRSFVVWGDSHADALMPAFDELASRHHVTGIYLGRIGCPPLLGIERPDTDFRCVEFNDASRRAIAASGASTVFLVARWAHYTADPTYGSEPRTRVILRDEWAGSENARNADNGLLLDRGLRRTLASLAGHRIVVVAGIPEVGYAVPSVLARIHHLGSRLDIRPARGAFEARQRDVQSLLDAEQREFSFLQWHPSDALCDRTACEVMRDGRPLYIDGHHLSLTGAHVLATAFEPQFSELLDRNFAAAGAGPP